MKTPSLSTLYLVLALAPFEIFMGISIGNPGPLALGNILLGLTPLLIGIRLRDLIDGVDLPAALILLGAAKLLAIAAPSPPLIHAILDTLIIVSATMVPARIGGELLPLALGALGAGMVLVRQVPLLPAGGLILETAALVLSAATLRGR